MKAKTRLSVFCIRELQVLETLMTYYCRDQESTHISKYPQTPYEMMSLSEMAHVGDVLLPRRAVGTET